MVRSLSFSILLTMLISFFQTADVTSGELITCEFRTGQATSITLTCLFPEGTDVRQSHLTVYLEKKLKTVPVSVVDCIRADGKKDADCEVEPGYYYDKVMYTNHTSIQLINASDTHLGKYYCQLMGSGLKFEKCELTAQHLAELHEALTTPSPDWRTRLATETRSSSAVPEIAAERGSEGSTQDTKLEEGNHTKSFATVFGTGFGVGGFVFILLIVGAIWYLWRKGYCSNLKWLPCTAKKTQRHMEKDDNTGEEEREKLMTNRGEPDGPAEKEKIGGLAQVDGHCRHTTDDTIIDINENTPHVSPEPDRLQDQENLVGEHVAAEISDNIDGPGTNIEEVSTPQTATSSRTENDRGTISPRLSSRCVNNMSDRSKDTEDKAGLVQPDSQEQTGEGAFSRQSATVSITREPDGPEAIEEQARSANNETQETTTSNGSDTNSCEAQDETTGDPPDNVPAGQNKPQRKVSSKETDDRFVSTYHELISPYEKRVDKIRLQKIITEKTTKPSGEVTERTDTLRASCSLTNDSEEDVSSTDPKITWHPTETNKTDEKKSISREGAKESSGLSESDCDVRKPFKMKREAASPENMYGSGWNDTDKPRISVQDESHTSNTSSELATGREKHTENPSDNCSSSYQKNQNFSATSTFAESPERTDEQQDTNRYDTNVSLATKNAQDVSEEEEESETLTLSPTAGINLKVRKL